jgi:UDP-N-acetylmuramate--alanine ligase
MQHIHLIGIAGSGLSAIALVLLESGYTVSGSDRQPSPLSRRLEGAGAQVFYGHRSENVAGADLVVRSSAVPDDNVEVQAARAFGIPVLKRSDFLGQLLNGRTTIAVAGTHGKTTTTAMIAWMLTALGKDPSYVIGGVSANLGTNAHAGKSDLFVIEADEYDRMFLGLQPHVAVVTNVEHDHPDCYTTPQDFQDAFASFVACLQPSGTLVTCADDPGAAALVEVARRTGRHAVSYSLETHTLPADYTAANLGSNSTGGYSFTLLRSPEAQNLASVQLQVPGRHNASNALAALAVADLLALPIDQAAAALNQFRGTARRFEIRGQPAGVTVIDDYAHHPTEIRATLQAAQVRFPGCPLWAVWQPHTYSRTRTLAAGFLTAFTGADHVIVTEVYAAREALPADGFSAHQLVQQMPAESEAGSKDVHFAATLAEAVDILIKQVRPGEVVLVFSAGDADWISTQLVQALSGPALQGEKNA